ncbi:MAG: hypothetical protein KC586_06955, partial [Myxococcales bacterium]|nr:hypothetical protein [Myxococcales bacterium]
DGKDRTYRIRVRAYDAAGGTARPPDSFVAETRAVNRYARGEVRELRLLLLNECIGQMCEQNQRCVARGLCETLQEDPLVPVADAGISESDAGPDAGPPECSRAADCDDDDPCTDDACVEGRCERANNTASCNDGLFCTTNDVCSAGVCMGGDDPCGALECDDTLNACVGCTDSCPDVVGEWGECSFADDCATTGTQTRSVSSATCSAGACMASGAPRTEMQACTRMDTSDQLCGDPTEMPGSCVPSSGGCGTLAGNRTIVVMQPTCGGGSCGSVPSSRMEACTVTVPCTDAGVPDGGVDAGHDAGGDAGSDAGADSGPVVTVDGGVVGDVSLLFTEYVEGSSNNRALEITNVGTVPVDLTTCVLNIYTNGATTVFRADPLSGFLAPGGTLSLCNAASEPSLVARCDRSSSAMAFNGNDALELVCGGAPVDVFGSIGPAHVGPWGTPPTTSTDATLRRKCSVRIGDTNGTDAFDPSGEWDGFPLNTYDDVGIRVCP